MFLASPTESPFIGTIGILNESSISFSLSLIIFPTVIVVLIDSIINSLCLIGSTFAVSSSPTSSLNNLYFIFIDSLISGRERICFCKYIIKFCFKS